MQFYRRKDHRPKNLSEALRLAVWVVVLIVVINGGIYIYGFFLRVSVSKTNDVKPAANGVAVFREKLPPGFVWKSSAHVNEIADAISVSAPDGQEVQLVKLKNISKQPEKMLDDMTTLRKHAGAGNYIYLVANSGTDKIADAPLIWKVVNLDKRGEHTQAFYGIVTPKPNEIVMITGTQKSETYNLAQTMEFLNSIKSWQSSSSP